jgi:proteasome component ECM29
MVLLCGDSDPDVRRKADSYLRAHMDAHRGKDVPRRPTARDGGGGAGGVGDAPGAAGGAIFAIDALLGNSVALAQTLLTFAIGGASSMGIERALSSLYGNSDTAGGILRSRLGLTYRARASDVDAAVDVGDPAASRRALLSCARTRTSEQTASHALKFVAKMLDDDPRIFRVSGSHGGAELDDGSYDDVAAVSIGTLALAVVGDLHRPGSSASQALDSAASLLGALSVRLSLFYDARARRSSSSGGGGSDDDDVTNVASPSPSLERMRSLLASCARRACAVLAPTSTGESASSASGIQVNIRDRCYGVLCTLSRSFFALDDGYALFDCGGGEYPDNNDDGGRRLPSGGGPAPPPLRATSTAALLFGCSSNEVEMLRPRATSALDALLAAKVRVVKFLAEKERALLLLESAPSVAAVDNPWAVDREVEVKPKRRDVVVGTALSRSLLPLLWRAARRNQPKSSRLASARWSSELLLRLDDTSAFHLLCFMSGDDDATVVAIAKQALGVDKTMGEDNILSLENSPDAELDGGGDTTVRVAFSVLMGVIVGSSPMDNWPKYSNFPVIAKAVTIRFLLQSLFSEVNFYADKDDGSALKEFVAVILRTLAFYEGRPLSRDETDLIDECAVALASCTLTSKDARLVVAGRDGVAERQFSYSDIANQALTSNSSKTRVGLVCFLSFILRCLRFSYS